MGRKEEARQAFLEAERLAPPGGGTSAIPRLSRLSLEVELGVAGAHQELERLVVNLGQTLRPRESLLVYETLADARARAEDLPGAIQALDASRRALRIHRQINLSGLSQSDQLAQVQALRPLGSHHRLFEFAGKIRNASLAEMTGEWVLNDKGFVHEVLADFQRFQRSLASTQDRQLSEELQITQGTIAKALGAGASADQPALTRLIEQADQLSLQLGVAARVSHLSRPWVTIADLRRSIPEDAVLIEVLRTNAGQEAQSPAGYQAWVIPPAGKGGGAAHLAGICG